LAHHSKDKSLYMKLIIMHIEMLIKKDGKSA